MTPDAIHNRAPGGRAAVVAVILAALASLFVLTTKFVTQTRYAATGVRTVRHVSLWDTRGASALLVLSIPVVITLVALVATRATSNTTAPWIAAALLWFWVIAFIRNVGGFYVPAAIAATFAAVASARQRGPRRRTWAPRSNSDTATMR